MTESGTESSSTPDSTPRQVPGDRPGDYGVAPVDEDGRFGAAGDGDPIELLTAPLDEDDDVYDRLSLVNTEQGDRLQQIRNRVRGEGHGDR